MPLSLEIMWSNFDKQRPLTVTYISNNGYVWKWNSLRAGIICSLWWFSLDYICEEDNCSFVILFSVFILGKKKKMSIDQNSNYLSPQQEIIARTFDNAYSETT